MNSETFYLEELDFIDSLKDSPQYQRLKELSKEIDEDEELVSLAKRRDDYYQRAYAFEVPPQELLIEAKRCDDEIHSHQSVKEYMKVYKEIKDILKIVEEGILQKAK